MNSKFLNLEIHLHYSLLTSIINKANIKKKKLASSSRRHICPQQPLSGISRSSEKRDHEEPNSMSDLTLNTNETERSPKRPPDPLTALPRGESPKTKIRSEP